MTSKDTHSPLPWFLKNGNEIHDRDMKQDEHGAWIGERPNCIAKTCCFNTEANAAHIVKCVNAHDELVEALGNCVRIINRYVTCFTPDDGEKFLKAEQALEKWGK